MKSQDCLNFKNHDYKTIILPNNNIKFVGLFLFYLFFPIIRKYILGIFSFYLFKVKIKNNFPSKTTLKVKIKAFYRLPIIV